MSYNIIYEQQRLQCLEKRFMLSSLEVYSSALIRNGDKMLTYHCTMQSSPHHQLEPPPTQLVRAD